jgi:hypothetical protein
LLLFINHFTNAFTPLSSLHHERGVAHHHTWVCGIDSINLSMCYSNMIMKIYSKNYGGYCATRWRLSCIYSHVDMFIDMCFVLVLLHVLMIALCFVLASCRRFMETLKLYTMVGLYVLMVLCLFRYVVFAKSLGGVITCVHGCTYLWLNPFMYFIYVNCIGMLIMSCTRL